jgi:hypothetical protein
VQGFRSGRGWDRTSDPSRVKHERRSPLVAVGGQLLRFRRTDPGVSTPEDRWLLCNVFADPSPLARGRSRRRDSAFAVEDHRRGADSNVVIVRYIGENREDMRGREFVVLSVMVTPGGRMAVMFMLYCPEAVADWAWYDANEFEVLDHALPSNWVYTADRSGFSLRPAAWARPGHWDDLLNEADPTDRQRAWTDHRTERDLILAEAGRPPGREGDIVTCKVPPSQWRRGNHLNG